MQERKFLKFAQRNQHFPRCIGAECHVFVHSFWQANDVGSACHLRSKRKAQPKRKKKW